MKERTFSFEAFFTGETIERQSCRGIGSMGTEVTSMRPKSAVITNKTVRSSSYSRAALSLIGLTGRGFDEKTPDV
jgi:hypothetical protein